MNSRRHIIPWIAAAILLAIAALGAAAAWAPGSYSVPPGGGAPPLQVTIELGRVWVSWHRRTPERCPECGLVAAPRPRNPRVAGPLAGRA